MDSNINAQLYQNLYSYIQNNNISGSTTGTLKMKNHDSISSTQVNKSLRNIFKITKINKNAKVFTRKRLKKIRPKTFDSEIDILSIQPEDKVQRLKTLAKSVKILRRKINTIEKKVKNNSSKILNQHIWSSLGINPKNIYLKNQYKINYDNIITALKKISEKNDFEFNDQKHLIRNLVNLIAEGKLKPNSTIYNQICNILRLYLPKDKVKQINERYDKYSVNVNDKELPICFRDYRRLSNFGNEALNAVFGVEEETGENLNPLTANFLSYLQPSFNLLNTFLSMNYSAQQNDSKKNENNMLVIK
jgi:DNA-binding XRE family transcriptional regulator